MDSSTGGIKSGVTWTVRRCIDGTFAAATGTATEDSTNGWYKFAMSQADTNGNNIQFNFTGTGAVPQTVNIITTACDPTTATNFGITSLPATAVTTNASLLTSGTGTDQLSVTSGRIDIGKALGTAVTLDSNNVLNVSTKYLAGTSLTGRDIGASVLLSAGSGTGQLDFTSGVVKANLAQILGTALTETAGQIAAAFKKLFDVASPVLTAVSVNQTGDSYARLGAPAGASVSTDIAAAKVDTAAIKVQTDKLTFTVANQIDANVLDWKSATAPAMTGDAYAALVTTTYAEPSAVPSATAKIVDMIHYLFTKTRNKSTQTATTQLIRNDADNATIATVTVSDDGTTFTKSIDT